MYGILYAYTPESFPAPHRGTGDALCSALNRIGGLIAPLIKIATTPATGTVSANTANGCVTSLFSLARAYGALFLCCSVLCCSVLSFGADLSCARFFSQTRVCLCGFVPGFGLLDVAPPHRGTSYVPRPRLPFPVYPNSNVS